MTEIHPGIRRLARLTAEKIERDGWHRGDFWPGAPKATFPAIARVREAEGKPCCILGAYLYAREVSEPAEVPLFAFEKCLIEVIRELREGEYISAVTWNDEEARTVDDVLQVLYQIAEER